MENKIDVSAVPAYGAFPYYSAGEMLAMVSLTAPNFKPEARAPIDAVAVIDRSGSMRGPKLQLVQKTLHFMIDALQGEDKISIVTFDDSIRTDLPLTALNENGKLIARSATDQIRPGNSTDLCGGLLQGVKELTKREKKS